jgi:hypothetical protein
MFKTNLKIAAIAIGVLVASAAGAKAPDTWDNLHKFKAKNVDVAYLLPDADFRAYTKVMLDPAEVAFEKNWKRDYNNSTIGLSRRITDEEALEALQKASASFNAIFADTFAKGGYQIVTAPGPDVLRIRAAVINIRVAAPDQMSAGRTRSFSSEAGSGTLVIEVRDSQTNAVMGRVVDSRLIGDTRMQMRSSVTNRADFEREFENWAKISVKGIDTLKANSPLKIPAK